MTYQLKEVSFKNKLDQVLQPGDKVLYITSGRGGRIKVATGLFAGTVNGLPSVHVTKKRFGYWRGDVRLSYREAKIQNIEFEFRFSPGRTTLKLGRVYKLAE